MPLSVAFFARKRTRASHLRVVRARSRPAALAAPERDSYLAGQLHRRAGAYFLLDFF
jgi:hypothetical protein